MNNTPSQDALPARVIAGNESAWFEMDEMFRSRICHLVEREMNKRYRSREDPDDVAVSVMKSFFQAVERGRYEKTDFKHTGALWKLLQKIARTKILKHVEYHEAQKRTPKKEEHVEGELPDLKPTRAQADALGWAIEQALNSQDETESSVLRLTLKGYLISDIVRIVLENLAPPYPEILALRLQGHTESDIAKKLGIGREAVKYRLLRIQKRLSKLLAS